MSDLHVVLGATGAVGSAVVTELHARGHEVRAVSRGAEGLGSLRADITTADGAAAACEGAAVVYQCAQPPYAQWATDFVGLTDTVLTAVEQAGARLVMADNLYMYGPVEGPMTEELPYAAAFPKGRARAQVAEMILSAHREGRVRATLGRASDYFGPGGMNTILGPNIFAAAAAGKTARWVGERDEPHTVAYLPDLAAGLVTLGEDPKADGYAWHLPVGPPVTGDEFLALVWGAAGGRPRSAGIGRAAQRFIGMFNPVVRELGETWYQRDRAWVVDDTAFRAAFGDQRVTPLEQAIAETVAWFKRKG
ncbi:NAD-dependent epimerase/dehydratase family protein [Glycomyces sp. TRM65418]|uniref:NAD-dependent epimerase/dehydratase family protein n=1 Tax=Glycomyces sp. TRM65418 TaxID=2867006 RepID=UPI001CE54B46|nr:NAD-dependent epimerase/dehydratase family protein [Glycomyces sp. TRM65418]MCC3765108.1 NAD-dependent epimerase/dehydratase family protein [Glycomyces sp. TRM65418]QZD54737.1 NAD-dependent epimerase/dehydratase family protein [Glycomyces sp. TRM65418]